MWLSLYLAVNTGIPFCDTFMTEMWVGRATPVVCLHGDPDKVSETNSVLTRSYAPFDYKPPHTFAKTCMLRRYIYL